MVTGDQPHTATAIAREIGLVRAVAPVVITGVQLEGFSDVQLQAAAARDGRRPTRHQRPERPGFLTASSVRNGRSGMGSW